MPRSRAIAVGVLSIGLAFASAPTSANAGRLAAASLKSPTPPRTGTWKVNDSQDLSSGSLVVYKQAGRREVKDLHGVLNSFNVANGCAAGPFRVKGSLVIRKVKVSKTQDAWAVGNGWNNKIGPGFKPVLVEVVYGGKTVHAKLQVSFADPHQKPTVGAFAFQNGGLFSSFAGHDCGIAFGLKHK